MLFFFNRSGTEIRHQNHALGTGLMLNGLLCLLFGVAIIVAPDLLAYFVATLLLLLGITLLGTGWKIRKFLHS